MREMDNLNKYLTYKKNTKTQTTKSQTKKLKATTNLNAVIVSHFGRHRVHCELCGMVWGRHPPKHVLSNTFISLFPFISYLVRTPIFAENAGIYQICWEYPAPNGAVRAIRPKNTLNWAVIRKLIAAVDSMTNHVHFGLWDSKRNTDSSIGA